jgi:D-beta-D-heptose 7-phosphate kinase/D-beta-D-heptose 1-phosphate adenosyltransferase
MNGKRKPRLIVMGDLMLDRYIWGDVERISPEAPVPVLRMRQSEDRPGGAGSVAAMLAALEAQVALLAVTGEDAEAKLLRQMFDRLGVDCSGVLTDPQRTTTIKQRLLGSTQGKHPQQMLRVDQEQAEPISQQTTEQLLETVADRIAQADLILISDYNKGVCAGQMLPRLVELARAASVPIIADPLKGADYRRYAGCTCITPNRREAELAAGMSITSPQEAIEAGRRLLGFGVQSVVVTLDSDGMVWVDGAGHAEHFPCRPRQVCDVTGAGDMVLAMLGYCLAAGMDWPAAIRLANIAGGLEVERLGAIPIGWPEILAELSPKCGHGRASAAPGSKIRPLDDLLVELARRRQKGQKVAFTNGCFDLLHPGHVAFLQAARQYGDCLVVGLNSDRSVQQLKGPGRPIIPQEDRAAMLAALESVDYVVIFDQPTPAELIASIRPNVLLKGSDYEQHQVAGRDLVESYGGRVVCLPLKAGYSTTCLLARTYATEAAIPGDR